jgi:hypothetical protein
MHSTARVVDSDVPPSLMCADDLHLSGEWSAFGIARISGEARDVVTIARAKFLTSFD